ncbi:MAG: hypothetical protein AAF206_25565, partial [Bacteroidota bacterium]
MVNTSCVEKTTDSREVEKQSDNIVPDSLYTRYQAFEKRQRQAVIQDSLHAIKRKAEAEELAEHPDFRPKGTTLVKRLPCPTTPSTSRHKILFLGETYFLTVKIDCHPGNDIEIESEDSFGPKIEIFSDHQVS